jgi:hypothetical protein
LRNGADVGVEYTSSAIYRKIRKPGHLRTPAFFCGGLIIAEAIFVKQRIRPIGKPGETLPSSLPIFFHRLFLVESCPQHGGTMQRYLFIGGNQDSLSLPTPDGAESVQTPSGVTDKETYTRSTLSVSDASIVVYIHESLTPEEVINRLVGHYKHGP